VILTCLAAILVRVRASERFGSLKNYFLGDGRLPGGQSAVHILAETSTLTNRRTPHFLYRPISGFLTSCFGYLLARIVISVLLLPQYLRAKCTRYELMRGVFGERIRN